MDEISSKSLLELKTVSQIADDLDEPPQRVGYIINKLRLKPHQRIGIIRLFTPQQAALVKQGLYNMQVRKA